MLKIGFVSLFGLVVLGWFVLGPGQMLQTDPPPTIRADLSALKHRPEGHAAAQNVSSATRFSSRQDGQDAPAIDALLRLSR